jgi:HSP20 family protein
MADIVWTDPFRALRLADGDFGNLRSELQRMMGGSLLRGDLLDEGSLDVDVYERDGKVMVEASLPGFTKDEIDVQLHEGVLAIKAEHSEKKEEKGKDYYRRERRYGAVARRIALPGIVTDAPVEAVLKDGVLQIEIAVPSKAQPKAVEVKAA